MAGRFFTVWATREAPLNLSALIKSLMIRSQQRNWERTVTAIPLFCLSKEIYSADYLLLKREQNPQILFTLKPKYNRSNALSSSAQKVGELKIPWTCVSAHSNLDDKERLTGRSVMKTEKIFTRDLYKHLWGHFSFFLPALEKAHTCTFFFFNWRTIIKWLAQEPHISK